MEPLIIASAPRDGTMQPVDEMKAWRELTISSAATVKQAARVGMRTFRCRGRVLKSASVFVVFTRDRRRRLRLCMQETATRGEEAPRAA